MRILHVNNILHMGGVLRHMRDHAECARQRGHTVWLAGYAPPGHEMHDDASFVQLPLYTTSGRKSMHGALRAALRLRAMVLRERIDVVHLHSRYTTLIAALAGAQRHTAVMYTVHNVFADATWLRWYPRHVIAPSETLRRSFQSNAQHAERSVVTVLPYGIPRDTAPVAPRSADAPFLFLGRLEPNKRPELALEALALLRAEGRTEVDLNIVGSGELEDALHARRDALGLARCCHLRGYSAQPGDWIRSARALLLTSDSLEAMPYVILEAMAMGTVVIAADMPQIRELIEHGRNGVLFRLGDAGALAAAMRRVLENAEEARDFALRAREEVRLHHDLGGVVDRTLALYADAIRERGISDPG